MRLFSVVEAISTFDDVIAVRGPRRKRSDMPLMIEYGTPAVNRLREVLRSEHLLLLKSGSVPPVT